MSSIICLDGCWGESNEPVLSALRQGQGSRFRGVGGDGRSRAQCPGGCKQVTRGGACFTQSPQTIHMECMELVNACQGLNGCRAPTAAGEGGRTALAARSDDAERGGVVWRVAMQDCTAVQPHALNFVILALRIYAEIGVPYFVLAQPRSWRMSRKPCRVATGAGNASHSPKPRFVRTSAFQPTHGIVSLDPRTGEPGCNVESVVRNARRESVTGSSSESGVAHVIGAPRGCRIPPQLNPNPLQAGPAVLPVKAHRQSYFLHSGREGTGSGEEGIRRRWPGARRIPARRGAWLPWENPACRKVLVVQNADVRWAGIPHAAGVVTAQPASICRQDSSHGAVESGQHRSEQRRL